MDAILLGGNGGSSGLFPKIRYSRTAPTSSTGSNNDIVVVSDRTYAAPVYVMSYDPPATRANGKPIAAGDIWIKIALADQGQPVIFGGNGGVMLRLCSCRIYDNTKSFWKPVESYVFNKTEAKWNLISKALVYIIDNGKRTDDIGTIALQKGTYTESDGYVSMKDSPIYDGSSVSFNKKIALTGYTKIKIAAIIDGPTAGAGMVVGFSNDTSIDWPPSGLSGLFIENGYWNLDTALGNVKLTEDKTLEFNLPQNAGEAYFKIYSQRSYVRIKSITLE